MDKIQCTQNIQSSITVLSNQFIDKYMVAADGEYVKVYLLLLRLLNQGIYTGPEQIADRLDLMQKDVLRAYHYWEKEGLLQGLSTSASKPEATTPVGVSSQPPTESSSIHSYANESDILNTTNTAGNLLPSYESKSLIQAPEKKEVTPSEIKDAMKGTNFSQTCYMTGAYIGHPLSQHEVSSLYYIEQQLHFAPDLLDYLIEYCVGRGKKSIRYIERVAIAWYEQGIDTVKKAKEQSVSYNQNVFAILKAFGISNRNPVPAEMEYINRWNRFGFDLSIIEEACNRTMLATHQASFPYATRILEQWKNQGVRTLKDIEALDQNFHAKKPAVSVTTNAGHASKKATTNNAFHNFEQRTYDYDDLEAKLQERMHSDR